MFSCQRQLVGRAGSVKRLEGLPYKRYINNAIYVHRIKKCAVADTKALVLCMSLFVTLPAAVHRTRQGLATHTQTHTSHLSLAAIWQRWLHFPLLHKSRAKKSLPQKVATEKVKDKIVAKRQVWGTFSEQSAGQFFLATSFSLRHVRYLSPLIFAAIQST